MESRVLWGKNLSLSYIVRKIAATTLLSIFRFGKEFFSEGKHETTYVLLTLAIFWSLERMGDRFFLNSSITIKSVKIETFRLR